MWAEPNATAADGLYQPASATWGLSVSARGGRPSRREAARGAGRRHSLAPGATLPRPARDQAGPPCAVKGVVGGSRSAIRSVGLDYRLGRRLANGPVRPGHEPLHFAYKGSDFGISLGGSQKAGASPLGDLDVPARLTGHAGAIEARRGKTGPPLHQVRHLGPKLDKEISRRIVTQMEGGDQCDREVSRHRVSQHPRSLPSSATGSELVCRSHGPASGLDVQADAYQYVETEADLRKEVPEDRWS